MENSSVESRIRLPLRPSRWLQVGEGAMEKIRVKQSGMEKIRARENGMEKIRVKQSGMEKIRVKQSGMEKIRVKQSGMEKIRARESGIEKIRAKQSGMEKIQVKQSGMEKIRARESGMEEISWHPKKRSWQVDRTKSGRKYSRHFRVAKYWVPGMSEAHAKKAAMDAAIDYLKIMEDVDEINVRVQCGIQNGSFPDVAGIHWNSGRACWVANLKVKGKLIHGGHFKPRNGSLEEMESARLLAVIRRRELEEMYGN